MSEGLEEFLRKFHRASKTEIAQIIKNNLGYWPHPDTSKEEALEALDFRVPDPRRSPVDKMRQDIVAYIEENEGRLSMKCDGNCWDHPDGVVVACHLLLIQEKSTEDDCAETSPEDV